MAEYGLRRSLDSAARRAGKAEKFVTLLLLFILLTAATAGVSVVLTGPNWGSLWQSLLFGLLLGWVLAVFRWPALRSAVVVIMLGLLISMLYSGGLTEKLLVVFTQFARLIGGAVESIKAKNLDLSPLAAAMQQVLISTQVVLGRVANWINDLRTGKPSFDPVAAGIVWSFFVWLVAAWAGWVVEAVGNALLAVLPALLLNLLTLSYGRNNSASIYLLLGVTLVLIGVVQYDQREQSWKKSRIAFPARKGREIGRLSLVLAIILVVLSAAVSSLSIQRIINLESKIRRPSNQSESGLAKSLGILPAATATPDPFSTSRSPGLPRELLIGAGPELTREQVMSVKIADLAALLQTGHLPPLYWRSFTYDVYTGHGWSTSATVQSSYLPGEAIQPEQLPAHMLIQASVNEVPESAGAIYAAGEPESINVSTSAAWRSSNDLFGIQSTSNSYEVQSSIPIVDEKILRTAGQDYPSWVTQRYLALPPEVPTRVKQLAIQLTATEPTPFDRAHAIEQYLRSFPYTLDVPHPPASQDLADYFLFDLRKGYCDYYASAMVVLARAAGIPARLAVGYASGIYNENSRRFNVTQADAHSWTEVYFPGTGWVPFEPTAGLPAINRSGQPTQVPIPTPVTPAAPARNFGSGTGNIGKYVGLFLLSIIVAPFFLGIIIDEVYLQRLKPLGIARELYRRLKRYGKQLDVPLQGGETPFEFANALATRISALRDTTNLAQVEPDAIRESQAIISQVVLASYRPSHVDTQASAEILSNWRSLRWRLRVLWIRKTWISARQKIYQWFPGRSKDNSTRVG